MDETPLAGLRVLVVEDEYLLAEDLSRVLGSAGADVVGPIGSIEQAMRQIEGDGFDIAVLDVNLRDKMAYPLADELKRQGTPFVFATGYDQSVIPTRFAEVSRWEKPFDARKLVMNLSQLRSRGSS